jgi:FKBP-type peptidyl-prolyl cis-trans isomerase
MLVVPSALAYGRSGRGAVPPDAVLVFLIELLGVR